MWFSAPAFRYKERLSSTPSADLLRGEAFIEQVAGRMLGQEGQVKAKVGSKCSTSRLVT
jgi:hypothetical protein